MSGAVGASLASCENTSVGYGQLDCKWTAATQQCGSAAGPTRAMDQVEDLVEVNVFGFARFKDPAAGAYINDGEIHYTETEVRTPW